MIDNESKALEFLGLLLGADLARARCAIKTVTQWLNANGLAFRHIAYKMNERS